MGNYTEKELRDTLGQEMQVSEEVDARLSQIYGEIRAGKVKRKRKLTAWYRAAGSAAAVVAAGVFCVSNPAIAAKIPLIGHIFEEIGEEASYPGDYSQVGTALVGESEEERAADASAAGDDQAVSASAYVQSANGMTVTLSEVYCNDVALYLTMELKTEKPFENFMAEENGAPILALLGSADYSFNAERKHVFGYLDGKLVDENTYIGLYRMELAEARTDASAYVSAVEEKEAAGDDGDAASLYDELVKTVELPEEFELQLTIDKIVGDLENPVSIYEAAGVDQPTEEELLAMSDEEWHTYMTDLHNSVPEYSMMPNKFENYWYEGPFTFDLKVAVDQEQTITVPVEEGAEGTYYVSSVTKTPFELYVDEVGIEYNSDGVLQVLDADGKRLDVGSHGGAPNQLSVAGRNLSKIDIYNIPWDTWEDMEIKGTYFDTNETNEDGMTMKDLLDEYSTYHKEVIFE